MKILQQTVGIGKYVTYKLTMDQFGEPLLTIETEDNQVLTLPVNIVRDTANEMLLLIDHQERTHITSSTGTIFAGGGTLGIVREGVTK